MPKRPHGVGGKRIKLSVICIKIVVKGKGTERGSVHDEE